MNQEALEQLLAELRQYEPAVYAAGRTLMYTAWGWFAAGRAEGGPVLINPGGADSLIGRIWPELAAPLGRGMVDELQAQVEALVAPKVKKMVLGAAVGGIGLGFTVARFLGSNKR